MSARTRRSRATLLPLAVLGWLLVAPVPATAAEQAPGLTAPDLDGVEHGLDEWRGKVLLINFWASWCGVCQAEIPTLVDWQRRFAGRGLQLIGVGVDRPRPLRNVKRSLGIDYPILVITPDRSGRVLAAWGNRRQMVPYSVLVDRRGRVVHRQLGEFDQRTFDAVVAPLLDPPAAPLRSAARPPSV